MQNIPVQDENQLDIRSALWRRFRVPVAYLCVPGRPVLLLITVLAVRDRLFGPSLTQTIAETSPYKESLLGAGTIALTILQVCVIMVASRIVGRVVAKTHQPRVIGEILAGVL